MLRNDSATNTWRMKLQQDVRFGTPCSMFNVSVPYIVLAASVQGRKFETLLSPAPPMAWPGVVSSSSSISTKVILAGSWPEHLDTQDWCRLGSVVPPPGPC